QRQMCIRDSYQEEAPWGAVARVAIGGAPDLPKPNTFSDRAASRGEGVDPDPGFYPDPVWDEE
ncbi:hypothetical protein, partial [Blastococcus sp. TBT05-19]|uniref:hypothetical protein n=1 Tax=Blastococcus sp. TBT05-19 TaxID=2250581 RepID=UPI001F2C33F1